MIEKKIIIKYNENNNNIRTNNNISIIIKK